MRLEQSRYAFQYADESLKSKLPLENNEVYLSLNGIRSTIKVEDVFTSIQDKNSVSIKGYSPLQYLLKDSREELKSFTLEDSNGNIINIISRTTPFWQWSDETFDPTRYDKLVQELIRQCTPSEEVEPLETETGEGNGGGSDAVPVVNPVEEYNRYKDKFTKSGYQVEEKGNVSLFYMKEDFDDNILVITTGEKAEIHELEKKDDGSYVYENEIDRLTITKNADDIEFNNVQKEVKQE